MKTTIHRDHKGNLNLIVEGDASSAEAVARSYQAVEAILFPKTDEPEVKPPLRQKEKEAT